jgi:hypothetical protein
MADAPLTAEERMDRAIGQAAPEVYQGGKVVPLKSDVDAALADFEARVLSTEQLMNLPPPVPLVKGWIDQGTLNVLYGPPKLGKSFVAIDLAFHIATGSWWYGTEVVKTNVLYVIGEGKPYYRDRLRAWLELNRGATPEGLHWFDGASNLLDPFNMSVLQAYIEKHDIGLVIPDTLAKCMPGAEENSSKDMGTVVDHMTHISRATDVTWLAVHHTGKDQTKGLRGSSALLGAVDSSLKLHQSGSGMRLNAEDQRGHEQPSDKFFKLKSASEGAAIVDMNREGSSLEDLGLDKCEPVLKALLQVETEFGATASEWKRQATEKGIAEATFDRHKKALADMRQVHQLSHRGRWFSGPKPVPEDD